VPAADYIGGISRSSPGAKVLAQDLSGYPLIPTPASFAHHCSTGANRGRSRVPGPGSQRLHIRFSRGVAVSFVGPFQLRPSSHPPGRSQRGQV